MAILGSLVNIHVAILEEVDTGEPVLLSSGYKLREENKVMRRKIVRGRKEIVQMMMKRFIII